MIRARPAGPASLAFVLAAGACAAGAARDGDDDDDAPPIDAAAVSADAAARGCEALDILFVIDNSISMSEEQDNLALNFPAFMHVIQQSRRDYRVAVTTTGVDYAFQVVTEPGGAPVPASLAGGDNGAMLRRTSCGMTKRWVDKTDADPAATFACAAKVGTSGPTEEMPLAAMRRAFTDRVADGVNAGFRRPDAMLALVILTDEDDCSHEAPLTLGFGQGLCATGLEPPDGYRDFLDQYAGARGRWAAAVIAYPGPGVCTSSFGSANAATRLARFVAGAPSNTTMSSICTGDLAIPLARALDVFDKVCRDFPID